MKNITTKIIFSSMSVLFSTFVSATCLPVQGTVQTQSMPGGAEQVGTITMTSTSLLAFRRAFGQVSITGGIKGTITGADPSGNPVYLEHQIGFPGVGTIISYDDAAQVTGAGDSGGNLPVTETAAINSISNSGAFAGWNGQLVATGILGTLTGTNVFTYTGRICNS